MGLAQNVNSASVRRHGQLTGFATPSFTDRDRLNPALDSLVGSQLQHIQSLLSAAQMAAADQASVAEQTLRRHAPALALGQANSNELAMNLE